MRLRTALTTGVVLALAACAQSPGPASPDRDAQVQTAAQPVEQRFPSPTARTVEDFDLTTAAEREAAKAPSGGGERSLGSTVASLGDPSSQGFWLETPLVDSETEGRVVYGKTGESANVTLRPIPGEPGAGSRISLAAMRVLGASLTDLPTLEVYAGG